MRRAAPALIIAAALALPASAGAVEIPSVAGQPMLIDITNTSILNYHFDNRNDFYDPTRLDDPATRVDDYYGEWLDRLNVQISYWRFTLGVRLDTATFFLSPSRKDAKDMAYASVNDAVNAGANRNDLSPGGEENRYLYELNTRFRNTYYPAKLFIGYQQPGIEITLGDFYAQLGRGLVFSARKVDELAVDTTVRGAKVVLDREFGPVHAGFTAFAGQMNPVRIDEATGRRLQGAGSPLFFGFPKAQDAITYKFEDVGTVTKKVEPAQPSYLEDTVIGGHLEAGPSLVSFGLNGSMLLRKSYVDERLQCEAAGGTDCASKFPVFEGTNASRHYETIRTFSGSVNVPSILDHGDLYVEVAGQQLRDGRPLETEPGEPKKQEPDYNGYAIYVSGTVHGGPVSASLEGKRYWKFFPLSANIDRDTKGFAAGEFDVISYNQPPTAEPIYVEPLGAPNQCNTGGRARVDVRLTREMSVYAWLGRYVSFSEINAENIDCETKPEYQSNTWDTAVGSEIEFDKGQSHTKVWVGARVSTREATPENPDEANDLDRTGGRDVFYKEGYIRYDIVKHITGPFSLQFQGFHRRRTEPALAVPSWTEGENYTALQWAPHISAIFGYEYSTKLGCGKDPDAKVCHFVNGGLQWKSRASDRVVDQLFDTVSLTVGQRRGGLRCVSGTCREFPPFEGAKLELVSRF